MRAQLATALRRRGQITRRSVVLALLVAVAGAIFAAGARADGDPASDYLQANPVFLAAQTPAVTPAQRQLVSVVQAANRAGFGIRVAVVGSEYDLGSITALWRKPRLYARFLGLELSSVYRQRLLVVMPNGYGFSWPGHPTAVVYRQLATAARGAGGGPLATADLPAAAQAAVRALAEAAGVRLGPVQRATPGAPRRDAGGLSTAVIAAIVVAAMLAIGLGLVATLRGRRAAKPSAPSRRPLRARWAIPGFAALCVAVIGVTAGVVASRRSGVAPGTSAASVVTPPPLQWPAGRRPAPAFALHDQRGQPVSVSAYHGRPVIVTFVDPLCRNLCPLEAHVLNAAVGAMPARQRPAILAVSVDVYANRRADLLQDVRKWSLVAQWHWAVGSRIALAVVWRRYKIGVSVVTRRIAGNTINYITHSEAAYVIDARGYERALFVWPFYPQDLLRTLRQVS